MRRASCVGNYIGRAAHAMWYNAHEMCLVWWNKSLGTCVSKFKVGTYAQQAWYAHDRDARTQSGGLIKVTALPWVIIWEEQQNMTCRLFSKLNSTKSTCVSDYMGRTAGKHAACFLNLIKQRALVWVIIWEEQQARVMRMRLMSGTYIKVGEHMYE